MKKVVFCFLILAFPSSAFASTASSTIEQNINASSNNSNSQVTSHTDINVETNGQTTHYSSDEPNQSIYAESNNGTSKIEVNGKNISGSNGNEATTPVATVTAKPTHPMKTKVNSNFLKKLLDMVSLFFSKFRK